VTRDIDQPRIDASISAHDVEGTTQIARHWLSRIVWLVAATPCAAMSIRVLMRAKFSGVDSWFPMSRALDFLHSPSQGLLYQTLFFSQHIKFQYPPTALLLLDLGRRFSVNTSLQYNTANAFVLLFTGLLFALFASKVMGRLSYLGVGVPVAPIAYFVALRFYPNNLAFEIGQMQLGLGLLFLAACYSLLHDRRILAGVFIAIAGMTKPQFLPLGLLAAWRKDWCFVGGLLATAIVFTMTSIWLYGWYNHLDYLSVLSFLSRHGEYQHLNQSLGGILDRWLYHGSSLDRDPKGMIPQSAFPPYIPGVYIPVVISSLVMVAVPFLIKVKGADYVSQLIGFCLAAALFTMASPVAWVHHFNVLLPGYVVGLKGVFDRWKGPQAWVALSLVGLSFFLVGYPLVPANSLTDPAHNILQSHVFFGAFILVIVMFAEASTLPKYPSVSAPRHALA